MKKKPIVPIILAVGAAVIAFAMLIAGLVLTLAMCSGPGDTEPTGMQTEASVPETTEAIAPEVPVKVWDMETLPENLIAEGMAYAKSNDNVFGNLIMGAGPGKGLGGSQAFAYTFVGNYSEGDIFVMSPKSLKDPSFVSNWTNGEMLWVWVNGVELMQTVRLELVVNGLYTPFESVYYTIDENGQCQEAGTIPRAWGDKTTRGRIPIEAGFSGWIGIPLESFQSPEMVTSMQIHVGNSTIKAGNVLYLDEFWLTKKGEVPPLTLEELLYDAADSLTLGDIWNVEKQEAGEETATMGTNETRGHATATVADGKGVSKSKAVAYSVQNPAKTNSQNIDFNFPGLVRYGANIRGIKDQTDLIWFWVDSQLSADQLLHIQLNGVFLDDNRNIYTIVNNNGAPKLQTVYYRGAKGMVNGMSVVPYDGNTAGKYARIELTAGWSGWIGIPVENFCVNSDGTAAPIPSGRAAKLTFRLFGTENSLRKGDTLYFDEFWITEAGKMPELSDAELIYGYTPSYVRPSVTYGRIWNAEDSGNKPGNTFGKIESGDEWNTAAATVEAGVGVNGSNALRYALTQTKYSNGGNVLLETGALERQNFKIAMVTKQTDILWIWVDSAVKHDQLLHLQINGRLMGLNRSIYTIVEENGEPVIKEVPYSNDGALVTGGIGVVPSNGKKQTDTTTYVRIKLCDGWSGWIGVPVENFNVQSGQTVTSDIKQINKYQIRNYVTNKDVLKEADALYLDEFWLTKAGTMPELSKEELLYGYVAPVEMTGCIWNLEDDALTDGKLLEGVIGTDSSRSNATAGVYKEMGVLGSNALGYRLSSVSKTQTNNLELVVDKLGEYGCAGPAVKAGDMLWFWAYADLSADQLLHIQLNDVKVFLKQADIYTIGAENGAPVMQSVKWYGSRDAVPAGELGVVYPNGTSGSYARVLIRAGWSGWIGVLVDNFAVDSSGNTVNGPVGQAEKLVLRLYGTANSLKKGDTLYYDEFWITEANTMPALSNEALLYTYAEPEVEFAPSARYESGMIFQGGKPWQVHGAGVDGQTITVSLLKGDQQVASAQCLVSDSAWSVTMEPVTGSYDAYTVQITNGAQTHELNDVLFGEVWIAGGQSNMAYTVEQITTEQQQADLQAQLAANAHSSHIRFYTQSGENGKDRVAAEPVGSWAKASNWESVYETSATGIYFALKMQAELDMPVGFVVSAVGGTGLTSWVSADVAQTYTDYYTLITAKGYDQTSADTKDYLGGWYNSRVAPWQGYEAAGVIWYQGEHERSGNSAIQTLGLEVLVDSWSHVFDSEGTATAVELPLVAIQIAPYATSSSDSNLINNYTLNAAMREGVAKVVAKGGQAEIVSQYDLYVTVNDIHPKNKPELCARVADTALGLVYGKGVVYTGPVMQSVTYADNKITVTFSGVGLGLQYVKLNETDNYRILNDDHILNTADFYLDKLNGFTLFDGKDLIEVDAVIIGENQVQIEVPAGKQVACVYYGYGPEILSANLFNQEGFPAVPFCWENPDFVPQVEPQSVWNAEDAALTAGYDLASFASTNYDKISAIISGADGVSGSKALAYSKTTNTNNQSSNFTFKSAVPGFVSAQLHEDDVLWFWVDSDLESDRLLHVQLNNSHLGMHYIYTIVEKNGAPAISKLDYDAAGLTEGSGLALIASAGNAASNATYARIRLDTDWCGWIGIPVANFNGNGSTTPSGVLENLIFRLAGGKGLVGETLYMDEIWLTPADTMPALENSQLLYKEGNGSTEPPEETEPTEPTEPEVFRAQIWDQESNTKDVNVNSTYNDTASQQRNNSKTTVADGHGVGGSKALKFEALEAGSVHSTNGTTGYQRSITHTLSKLSWAGYGATDPTVQAADDIFWLWVDADLSTTQRFTFQLMGYDIKVQSGETYIYTIVSNNGAPEMVKIPYSADPNAPVDTVAGIDLVNENPNTNSASNAQIRLAKDFCGWIGIPLNMLKTAVKPGTQLTMFSLLLNQYSCEDPLENQQVGDCVYMDEFWLTAAGAMPKLSDELLLYKAG